MQIYSRAVFKRGFLGMGVVLSESVMKLKMSWHWCGFKSEFNEIQDVLLWVG